MKVANDKKLKVDFVVNPMHDRRARGRTRSTGAFCKKAPAFCDAEIERLIVSASAVKKRMDALSERYEGSATPAWVNGRYWRLLWLWSEKLDAIRNSAPQTLAGLKALIVFTSRDFEFADPEDEEFACRRLLDLARLCDRIVA